MLFFDCPLSCIAVPFLHLLHPHDLNLLAVSGNSATQSGGGLFAGNFGTTTLTDCTVSGNSAVLGGGLYSRYCTLTLTDCTVSGNTATGNAGGVYSMRGSTTTLTDCTVSGNSAGGHGGGLFGAALLHNTLIAGNVSGPAGMTRDDVNGNLAASDYNLIGDGTGMTGISNGVNGNLVGSADAPIDPLLDALGDNGGPTPTMALLPGSPALNAGAPDQLGSTDQRGVVRSGGVNIGAYQASATNFLASAPDTVQSGVPFDVTVMAVDPFGQVAVGYTGTVTFSTSDPDPGVVLPADYAFTLDDGGSHTFTDTGLGETTLLTHGHQTITVADTADGSITGDVTVRVRRTRPGPSPEPGHGAVTAAPVPAEIVWLPGRSLHQRFDESEALAWDWLDGAVANLPADAFAPAELRPDALS
jgi:parallel beta-helix repeat protein